MTIIGGGRVGQALADMGPGSDVGSAAPRPQLTGGPATADSTSHSPRAQVVIRRNEPVSGPPGPIVVCTRNDDLQAIVDATAADRREDLVFIQNGMLQPWLDAQGLGENTQVRAPALS